MAARLFSDALPPSALCAMFEALDEGLIVHDATGLVVAANASALRLLGAEAAATGEPRSGLLSCIVHADGSPFADEELPPCVALETGAPVGDIVVGVPRAGGSLGWLRISSRPVALDGGRPGVVTTLVDVTTDRSLMEERARTQERLSSVLASIDDYLYAWHYRADGTVDASFESMPAAAFLGWGEASGDEESLWRNAVHPDDLAAFDIAVLDAQRDQRDGEYEYRIRTEAGEVRWLHERWRARPLEDGTALGEGIVSDVTRRRQLEEEVHRALADVQNAYADAEQSRATADRLARTDPLTGSANRRAFARHLHDLVGARESGGAALVLLDLDHFKAINDSYGHQAGDAVLVEVSRRLLSALRPDEMLARWGGEEFAACLTGVADAGALRARCEALRQLIADQPILIEEGALAVRASFGADLLTPGDDADDLIDRVDRALYGAKRRGRNQTRLATDAVSREDLDVDLPESVIVARALALAASVREGVQPLHTEQVAGLAVRIAMMLDQSSMFVARCRLAGLLHDVGKVAIPDSILAKPASLDDDEMCVMRQHAAIGAELVRRVTFLSEIAPAIRHHHEQWDGSGYPDGLAGEEIPLEARIVAAADAYSAMTSDRVYRAAREPAAARAELRRCAGTHLDPAVVDALLRVLAADRETSRRRLGDANPGPAGRIAG